MTQKIEEQYFEGERSLFGLHDAQVTLTTFGQGESPLKESSELELKDVLFTWKYPLWYSENIKVKNTIFETMARSGIWYTKKLVMSDSTLQAPKLFRRCEDISLKNVHFSDATETFWNCKKIKLKNVTATGDYFGMNSEDIYVDQLDLIGNYAFDGAKNVEIHNSTLVSKDAFWNCENVVIYDSKISGEYLAWNTKKITFINCTLESEQGLCYIKHLTLKKCRVLQTDLAFEYCQDIDATIETTLESIKNPINGQITAKQIKKVIFNDPKIEREQTHLTQTNL